MSNSGSAPASVHVSWDNGAVQDVSLSSFTGHTAHYRTTSNLGANVTSATAQIYSGWGGQFNLSHGPCGNPPPSATVTATSIPVVQPSPTASPEWGSW